MGCHLMSHWTSKEQENLRGGAPEPLCPVPISARLSACILTEKNMEIMATSEI